MMAAAATPLLVRDFEGWRRIARPLLAAGIAPEALHWSDARTRSLFEVGSSAPPAGGVSDPPLVPLRIPRPLLGLLNDLALFRDPTRWDLMYRLTWRAVYANRAFLEDDADPDVARARDWAKAVRRDIHKMHAFVRFNETRTLDGEPHYVAWFEPAHEILRRAAGFFVKRFPNMNWMIATPDGAAVWEGSALRFVDPPAPADLPRADATHDLWRTYYRSICNVARINPEAMQKEMPRRYWRHLPEASEIDLLIKEGREMHTRALKSPPSPDEIRVPAAVTASLGAIAIDADSLLACRRCSLWQRATQAVPGEGPERAALMLVGEQPGDEEDIRGRPFVGPAGRLLDSALQRTGLVRADIFVTNAVKHFKWEPRGKRRLHKKPDVGEIRACSTWLERDIVQRGPSVIVALGATAIRALLGTPLAIESARSQILRHASGAMVVGTYHPSAILRADESVRQKLSDALDADLTRAGQLVAAHRRPLH